MNSVVLDSSAVLAVINHEDGADFVRPLLDQAMISAVNAAEVHTKLTESDTRRFRKVELSWICFVSSRSIRRRLGAPVNCVL